MKKSVYFFGNGVAEGNAGMKTLLGGKGANLAEMTSMEIPVPAGFTITTKVCTDFYKNNRQYDPGLKEDVLANLRKVEEAMGERRFGDPKNPLLLSVRSGAKISMPGMMDTVLNIGLNDETIQGIIDKNNDERFAYDSYRRFIQMFSNVVKGLDSEYMEHELEKMREERGVEFDNQLSAADMKKLVEKYKAIYRDKLGEDFPTDPMEQLWAGIDAVFLSWNVKRAVEYRRIHKLPDNMGTAVNVQTMVFGNMGEDCATGVAFTRDPANGEKRFFGEFLVNAQGEDVVAGIRTPQPVNKSSENELPSMEEIMPSIYKELEAIYLKLEDHYKEMQDIEFTIENNKLWMLQTRTGKRTGQAAVKIAVDMEKEGMIDRETAILRVEPEQLDQFLHPQVDPKAPKSKICSGLAASPGAACGKIVFTADEAEQAGASEKVILVRLETSPDDIHGMNVAQGILTARGGMTSHAAVVARGMGKCCVAGCSALKVDYENQQFSVGNQVFKKGEYITLNGTKGEVYKGQVPMIEVGFTDEYYEFMNWVDEYKRLKVRTNADTPKDSQVAREFGAQGIGLCRTEHMFFEKDRIAAVRKMILADDLESRRQALEILKPMQKNDFKGIFKAMDGFPVNIRLLDPPLHEFLPQTDDELRELASEMGVDFKTLQDKNDTLHEFNPMLGHRGCRLGVTYPEIYDMQAAAIMEALCEVQKEDNVKVVAEIMIPLVAVDKELSFLRKRVVDIAEQIKKDYGVDAEYCVGTMIELPRAALTADQIACHADFFSFGTNDLTQTAFGLSRDDAGRFLPEYVGKKVLPEDPFVSIDIDGVGQLMEIAVSKGRSVKSDLKVGICGEHGGEPISVKFCHRINLNYVSCSPYRVPIARLAAAHAVLEEKK